MTHFKDDQSPICAFSVVCCIV